MTMPSHELHELWLVRHGETAWSMNGQHTSVTDLELTANGEAVAEGLAAPLSRVDFAQVLTSPRKRARRTAELAGFASAEPDEDLAEWAYGDYEGMTTPEIQESVPRWSVWTHDSPGGESAAEVAARLDRVVQRARAVDGRTLVFAHGHSLRVLAARWLGLEVAGGRMFDLDTATISVLGDDRGTPVVRRWNVSAQQ
ncbi:histidine phosphatase family protein [Aeromicrobium wangtongii]|uniref:Histidine phosphatase family protein n=1 Tax=Aeromicrobium wangtongii TaxID=2969247 RepID=A0ABY5M7N0_9ACTN|nr:histidine phosphatase family protein [Aeromicrobium wangtongii]MCD9199023.1 histidine phosphatase family protein [Aeromicrobium wangtongii]UUP12944.1 histidine phosphatase family protein [Aeromicrobium wangtongii]